MRNQKNRRRGATVILTAILMVVLVGMVAFAVDVGYMLVVRTQLQCAADSAALAGAAELSSADEATTAANRYAELNLASGMPVLLDGPDVEIGTWDIDSQTFTPESFLGNALRVTARRNSSTGGNGLFFAGVLGHRDFTIAASAVAVTEPRDICLVVDLSGSMNNDTEPGYSGSGTLTGGYASIRTAMMQSLFTDLDFGTYPGIQQKPGSALGVSSYSALSSSSGPLTSSSIGTAYRIQSTDSSSTRKQKAYKWMIDFQIASLMPNAAPAASSSNASSLSYWSAYLDKVTAQSSSNQNIGYRTYVQFMMDAGRETKPDGTNHVQLSTSSPNCSYHSEEVGGETFSFPPREQPTHACRRSLIAAIQEIETKNQNIPNLNQRDWVSVVAFDTVAGTVLHQALTGDYSAAKSTIAELQANSDVISTATETGLIFAYNHLRPVSEGGFGRTNTRKIVVLLTDGMPNLRSSTTTEISNYIGDHADPDFYSGSSYSHHNAALMQTHAMQALGWRLYPVGVGLDVDNDFMDRVARMGQTAEDDQAPRTSGDPSEYEEELREIFLDIIASTRVHLVQ